MTNCKPISTLLQPHHSLLKSTAYLLMTASSYRSTVGALQYLTSTRPDLTFAVNLVSQHMHAPSASHLQALKHILRYIKGTANYGIRILLNNSMHIYCSLILIGQVV